MCVFGNRKDAELTMMVDDSDDESKCSFEWQHPLMSQTNTNIRRYTTNIRIHF